MAVRDVVANGLVLLATLVVSAWSLTSNAQNTQCSEQPRPANLEFTLKDMHGQNVRLANYLGSVIILDFWATWCAPCRIEIPGFIEMLDEHEEQGLVVLGISINDSPEDLIEYAEELQMDYPVLVGDGEEALFDTWGPLVGFPTTFVIDRQGNVCHEHIGFTEKSVFLDNIQGLL